MSHLDRNEDPIPWPLDEPHPMTSSVSAPFAVREGDAHSVPIQSSARLLALYRTMARIRAFENAAEIASQGGVQAWGLEVSATPALVRGPLHLSTGQEAVAAGVCANLTREDLLT